MARTRLRSWATRLAQSFVRPLTATTIEIQSELAPEEFERELRRVPAIIERGGIPYLDARARRTDVAIEGREVDIGLRSGAIRKPRGGYGPGTTYVIEIHLTGRITGGPAGSVLSAGLTTISAPGKAFIKLIPPVMLVALAGMVAAVAFAPSLVLIPATTLVVAGVGFVALATLFRLRRRQKALEIARLLLVTNDTTASIVRDVTSWARRTFGELLDWRLLDVPGPMIIEAMRDLEANPGQAGNR